MKKPVLSAALSVTLVNRITVLHMVMGIVLLVLISCETDPANGNDPQEPDPPIVADCKYEFLNSPNSNCGLDFETIPYCVDCKDEEGTEGTYNILIDHPIDDFNSSLPLRPTILFVHGYGLNSGTATDPYAGHFLPILRNNFCKYGYSIASLEYRQDIKGFTIFPSICSTPEEEVVKTHYRAIQDLRQAIHLLYQNPENLGIDIENLFLMGNSQGATVILNGALSTDETEWLSALPTKYESLKDELGPWAPRYDIKGIVAVAGALYDPNLLDASDNIPLFMGHGVCDIEVPYKAGTFLECPADIKAYGSYEIACRAEKMGNAYSLHSVTGLGHDWTDEILNPLYTEVRDWIKDQVICGEVLQEEITIEANEVNCLITSTSVLDCE